MDDHKIYTWTNGYSACIDLQWYDGVTPIQPVKGCEKMLSNSITIILLVGLLSFILYFLRLSIKTNSKRHNKHTKFEFSRIWEKFF